MLGIRGLFNVLGYGLKYLFVTEDAKDVRRLATVMNMHLKPKWCMLASIN